MEVPITQFRQKLFDLVNQALDGKDVWVSHKGRRLRLVPEHAPSKLSRITPMQILAPGINIDDKSWKAELLAEMEREWQNDWERDFGPVRKQGKGSRLHARRIGKKR